MKQSSPLAILTGQNGGARLRLMMTATLKWVAVEGGRYAIVNGRIKSRGVKKMK